MTSYRHLPALADEVIKLLDPQPGEVMVDATIGLGGHAQRLLERLGKRGKLIGIDQDEKALQIARNNLGAYKNQLVLVCGNFVSIDKLVQGTGYQGVGGILFDLGVSSLQLDDPARGFSFNKSTKLDMRMSTRGDLTAEEVVNSYPQTELARIFWEYGQEPRSRVIARRIVEARKKERIETVERLVELIGPPTAKPDNSRSSQTGKQPGRASGRKGRMRTHPATKVFQALRIEVNDEINALRKALPKAWRILKPGGRVAVISFHSLEDRIVKNFFKTLQAGGSGRILTKKAVTPSWQERSQNPRARSAKLRAVEKE